MEQDRASSVCLDLSELPWQAEQGLGGDPTLIAATTTEAGLTVQYQLDTNPYPTGRKVSDEEIASLSIQPRPSTGMELYYCASNGLKLIP